LAPRSSSSPVFSGDRLNKEEKVVHVRGLKVATTLTAVATALAAGAVSAEPARATPLSPNATELS
jgi:hypothetical protein